MMMKSSCPLLLLGVCCLLLLHVQEGQGIKCNYGTGSGKIDCSDLEFVKQEDALHKDSCKADEDDRDYCLTKMNFDIIDNKGNPTWSKWCGCSKGLTDENKGPDCKKEATGIKICACNSEYCNNEFEDAAPPPPPPGPPSPPGPPPSPSGPSGPGSDNSGDNSDATSPIPALALLMTMTSGLMSFFYWTLY